jgi:glycogen debranching enzyme
VDHPPSPYAGTTPVAPLSRSEGTVTLVEGQTFCLSDRNGDMLTDLPHGLFHLDTRILSSWDLWVNGHRLEVLAVDHPEPFAADFHARARPEDGRADAEIVVRRRRRIGSGMREEITVTNYGLHEATVVLDLGCHVDFAGLFEVKEGRVRRHGDHRVSLTGTGLRFGHRHNDVTKVVELVADPSATIEPDRISWRAVLAPREVWEVSVEVRMAVGGVAIEPRFLARGSDQSLPEQRLASWRSRLPVVDSDHPGLEMALRRAGEDLGALRIFDQAHPHTAVLSAGAPWFMAVFGRDSLLTAWMGLLADPTLAQGVLETLARFQGEDEDPRTEEEPGRILHEVRFGAAGEPSLQGGDVYYGSVDATPLFVMLLGELRRWDLADEAVEALLPHADRALAWIEDFGDRRGSGYLEYEQRDPGGLANQGWKDSWDAVRHTDGELARTPIALCEVQGYVYAAFIARAHFALEAGDIATFERYLAKAEDLRRRFNEDFWLDEHGWFALGLDGDGRPIEALASNMGHCLWTGIIDPERAELVARRLVSDELFSGWGIRTLATSMAAFNPVSYHNGSVWPHDTAICAAGLARYGFVEESHRVIGGQVDLAMAEHGRLPELIAGFTRGDPASPAAYPTSCSPQAWASASPLLWLRTLLRLDPWAPQGRLSLHPELPPWLSRLRVEGIAVAGQKLTVSVEEGLVEVSGAGPLEVMSRPRRPITAIGDEMSP